MRTVVPVPRGGHLPFLGSPALPPLRLTGGIATPTRRYHGRMLIHPSTPACATHGPEVFAHTQVRYPRESGASCSAHALGTHLPGHHLFSDPGPRNDQRPGWNLFANEDTSVALAMHSFSLSLILHMMSLNIDMKIIRPWNCPGFAHFVYELLDFLDELQCGESW